MLRIAIVCFPVAGGSGVVGTLLARDLAQLGHHVWLVSTEEPLRWKAFPERIPHLKFVRVPLFEEPPFPQAPYESLLAGTLLRLIREVHLDILHLHYAIPHTVAGFLALSVLRYEGFARIPRIVTTLHGTDVTRVGRKDPLRELVKFLLKVSDAVTAVSRYLQKQAEELLEVSPVEVIPNFLPVSQYEEEKLQRLAKSHQVRQHLNIPEDAVVFLHVSNFRKVKRVDRVVNVFSEVLQTCPNVYLVLVGEGPEHPRIQRQVHDLGIRQSVRFVPVVPDIRPYLAISDIYLQFSEEESFGLSVLEALAGGVPAVVSATGGMKELVEDGKSGFLIPEDRLEKAVENCILLVREPSLRHRMRQYARQRARIYDSSRIIPQYEQIYRKVLAQSSRLVEST